ncbi:MAG: hypothetical protein V4722_14950 [Bacteroidota bacterium]
MKKFLVFATAALLISGAAFAGKTKKCGTKESCCKDKKENCCKDKSAKETKEVKAAKAAKVAKVAA